MSTHKILEITKVGPSPFIQFLQKLSAQNGWMWEFESAETYDLASFAQKSAVKVQLSLSEGVLSHLHVLSTSVRSISTLDSFFNEDGTWYPRILLLEAIRHVLVHQARDLDIRNPAFVVGEGVEVRVSASVLATMGFTDIYMVGDEEALKAHRTVLSRSHLGIRFHLLPVEELTMQAISASILINSADLSKNKSLLTDLSYFNYMDARGYVLDLNLVPVENLLLEEAKRAELKVLAPCSVATQITLQWLDRLQPQHGLTALQIEQNWMTFLKEISPSV